MLKKSKRIQSILFLVLVLLTTSVSCAATTQATNLQSMPLMESTSNTNYTDIRSNWAYEAISYVLDEGFFAGTSDTTFSPNKTITRTAFATVLARLAGTSEEDVDISNGTGNLTREDMAVLLYDYAKSIGLTINATSSITFTDASSISSDAKEAVTAVTSLGLMSGKSDGSFAPSGTTSRAEAATVIYRLCKLINEANTSDSMISDVSEKAASIEQYTNYKNDDYETITLNGSSISYSGTGATVDGNTITITKAGTYVISGTLKDGKIIVDSKDEKNVRLVLNNTTVASASGSPIIIKNAKNAVISLPSGTKNMLTDSSKNTDDEETTGTIFSSDDLWINGSGTLTINANYKDGISGNDDIQITQAKIVINSVDDGIVANDSISVDNANISITAAGDGIKTTNGSEIGKGFIAIKDGSFIINAVSDGIQAETLLYIEDGDFKITTSGSDTNSSKALKATSGVIVLEGTYDIDSTDDALHSNGLIRAEGGTFDINSGDDGLHADTSLLIKGGKINIKNCYEGIESANIEIFGGTINLISSDDGINVAGGASNSSKGGKPGQNTTTTTTEYTLTISGGDIEVNASGDGIDVNGSAYMTGGNVLVSGPTKNGNGALDYDGVFEVSGGTLLVAGSTGMAMAPSSGSTQYTIANTVGTQTAGTTVKLVDSAGNVIATFTPSKAFGHVVISSPDIKEGGTYTLYVGGTEIETFTISSVISGDTSSGSGMPGGGGRTHQTGGSGGTPPNQQ